MADTILMINEKYTARRGNVAKTYNTDDYGGGLTDTTDKMNVKTVVSGKDHIVHDAEGNEVKKSPAEVLIHEIVGHAAPALVGPETGNAVKNENVVRRELGLLEREEEKEHYE